MIISEIYEKYKIMPALEIHQLCVAAVAEQICESLAISVNSDLVVTACLVHDMGNIIKSKFDNNLYEMTPKEIEYWEQVKKEFIAKYGSDEMVATITILKELGISEKIQEIIKDSDFVHICEILNLHSIEKQVMKYCDLRVGPHGVVSLTERLEEAKIRYGKWEEEKTQCAYDIEKQIFSHSSIKPEDITEESVQNRIEKLKNTKIS